MHLLGLNKVYKVVLLRVLPQWRFKLNLSKGTFFTSDSVHDYTVSWILLFVFSVGFSASVHSLVRAYLWSCFESRPTGWEPLIIHYSVPLNLDNCVFVKLREQVPCTSMPPLRSVCACAGVSGTPWRYNSLIMSTEHTIKPSLQQLSVMSANNQ